MNDETERRGVDKATYDTMNSVYSDNVTVSRELVRRPRDPITFQIMRLLV